MNDSPSLLEQTRTEVIGAHLKRAMRTTRLKFGGYVEDAAALWLQRTPDVVRGDDFSAHSNDDKRRATNEQKVRRWFDGGVSARPSIDVEEALVLALPEPFRGDCLRELCMRYGGLFVAMPGCAQPLHLGVAGELVTQCGEALTALAPLLADGQIGVDDPEPALRHARRELIDVQSVIASLVARIDAALTQQQSDAKASPRTPPASAAAVIKDRPCAH